MSLQDEIDKTRQVIRTDGYSMSIGEWISLYEKSEIDIRSIFRGFLVVQIIKIGSSVSSMLN